MYGMDNELYRGGLMEFIKHLNRENSSERFSMMHLMKFPYPGILENKIIRGLYLFISRYKRSKKSKWITAYHDWTIKLNDRFIIEPYDEKQFTSANNKISKLITRKRGRI